MINAQTLGMIANITELIAEATRTVGVNSSVPKFLGIFANILRHTAPAVDDLMKLRELIKQMVNETREPTQDEWDALLTRSDIAHYAIQGVDLSDEGDVTVVANLANDDTVDLQTIVEPVKVDANLTDITKTLAELSRNDGN